jgi:hypothetical protein
MCKVGRIRLMNVISGGHCFFVHIGKVYGTATW